MTIPNILATVLKGSHQWPEAERSLFMDLFVHRRSEKEVQAARGMTQQELQEHRTRLLRRFRAPQAQTSGES